METSSLSSFCRARVVRIVPLYWIMTAAMISFYSLGNLVLNKSAYPSPNLTEITSSLFFVSRLMGFSEPVLYPGWTLEYEMAFYAVCAVALTARKALRPWLVYIGLSLLLVLYPDGHLFLEFGLGMVTFALAKRITLTSSCLRWPWILGFTLLLVASSIQEDRVIRSLTAAVLYSCILFVSLAPWPVSEAISGKLGHLSYPLYVVHVLALEPCFFILNRQTVIGDFEFIAFLVLATLFTIVCAWLVNSMIERPLNRLLHK